MDKETLEEAAEKIYPHHKGLTTTASNRIMLRRCAWIKGAKYQAERMYSEDAMLVAYVNGGTHAKENLEPDMLSKNFKRLLKLIQIVKNKENDNT